MPPRAGAGGPSSQARQSEGPKRSRAEAGALPGATGSGRRGEAGPMAAGGGPAPCLPWPSASPAGRGRWRGGGRRGRAKGQAGSSGEDALLAAPRARGGSLSLRAPWRPGRPRPRLDPREHVCSGAGRGRGALWVGGALCRRGSFCATWKVWMCSEDTSAERRGGRGPDIHTQCGPWAGEKSLQSLSGPGGRRGAGALC